MTTQEYMKQQGFEYTDQWVGNLKVFPNVYVKGSIMLFEDQARLMHATYIQGQIAALKQVHPANDFIVRDIVISVNERINALELELTELNKEA